MSGQRRDCAGGKVDLADRARGPDIAVPIGKGHPAGHARKARRSASAVDGGVCTVAGDTRHNRWLGCDRGRGCAPQRGRQCARVDKLAHTGIRGVGHIEHATIGRQRLCTIEPSIAAGAVDVPGAGASNRSERRVALVVTHDGPTGTDRDDRVQVIARRLERERGPRRERRDRRPRQRDLLDSAVLVDIQRCRVGRNVRQRRGRRCERRGRTS